MLISIHQQPKRKQNKLMCYKHRKYKAIRPPRVDCDPCWAMYEEKHGKNEAIIKYLQFFQKKELTKITR